MVWNWLRRHPNLVDVVLVLALAAGYVGGAAHRGQWTGGVPLAALQVAPLLWRRRYRRRVLAAVTTMWIAYIAFVGDVPPIATAVAIYTVAANLPRTEALRTAGVSVAASTLASLALQNWGSSASD